MKNIMLTTKENDILKLMTYGQGKKRVRLAPLPSHFLKILIRYTLLKAALEKAGTISRNKKRLLKENFYKYLDRSVSHETDLFSGFVISG